MALTAYITATPLDSGKFKDIYSSIREFKSRFKERFELDHYMGGVVDDTDPTCEGYHKQLTMNGGEYNATNIPATIPACPTGGIVFFSIGGELCCYDGNTAKQITDDGELAVGDIVDEVSGTTEFFYGVHYGNGLYVATSQTGKIYTSPDGITWTSRTSGTTNSLAKGCFGNSLHVKPGDSGTIITSPDGITWTSRTSGTSVFLRECCYSGSLFVVVGENGVILTSTDGITWTSRTSGTTTYLRGICYSGSIFVACGGNEILTSSDGITWTKTTGVTTSATMLTSCYFADGLFVLCGNSGTIYTSPDSSTWTSRTSGVVTVLRSITFGTTDRHFLIVGDDNVVLISADGATWTRKDSTGGTKDDYFGACYANDLYVICGYGGDILTFTSYITLP